MKQRFRILLCISFFWSSVSGPVSLIFDLNGVLFTTNMVSCLGHLGIKDIVHYMASTGKKPSDLKAKLYTILHTLYPLQKGIAIACDDEGNPLPHIMQAWNLGTLTHQEILTLTDTYIKRNSQEFKNSTEQILIWRLAQLIFDPSTFVATRTLIPEMATFIAECKKDGHQIFVLSNWDPTSFAILHDQYADFFSQFDGIFISGNHGFMKPDPLLFTRLITLYDLKPHNCIFFDDQKENIAAAQKLGMHTILCAHTYSYVARNRPNGFLVRQEYQRIMKHKLPIGR